MAEVHYLTAEGLQKLKAELDQLKGPAREDLARRLRFAIQQDEQAVGYVHSAARGGGDFEIWRRFTA